MKLNNIVIDTEISVLTKSERKVPIVSFRNYDAIHNWFLTLIEKENLHQVDEAYSISLHDIFMLVETCRLVVNQPSLAPSLLPRLENAYIGTDPYNKEYFDQLLTASERLLSSVTVRTNLSFFYHSNVRHA